MSVNGLADADPLPQTHSKPLPAMVLAQRVLRGEEARARGLLESVLAQNPDHFEARVLLAERAHRDGNPMEARHHLQQAAERGVQGDIDAAVDRVIDASAHAEVL